MNWRSKKKNDTSNSAPSDSEKTSREKQIYAARQLKQLWGPLPLTRGLSKLMRMLRLLRGLTRKQLADATGMTEPVVCRLENASRPFYLSHIQKIANALGYSCKITIELVDESPQRNRVLFAAPRKSIELPPEDSVPMSPEVDRSATWRSY